MLDIMSHGWLYCDSATFTGCRRRLPLLQTSARQVLVSQWTQLGHKLYLSFIISIKYHFMWRGCLHHCPLANTHIANSIHKFSLQHKILDNEANYRAAGTEPGKQISFNQSTSCVTKVSTTNLKCFLFVFYILHMSDCLSLTNSEKPSCVDTTI